jgi:hypothetical protein
MRALLVLLALCSVAYVSAGDEAILILQKTITHEYNVVAPGINFTVSLDIYNVGKSAAYEVKLRDEWPPATFTLLEGKTQHEWNEIPAGGHEQVNLTLTPKLENIEQPGFRAQIQYQPTIDASPQFGLSTNMRNITSITTALFEKATAKHYREWTIFGVLSALTILAPLAYWHSLTQGHIDGIPASAFKGKKSE